ncbi:MAG: hypothetical protein GWP09_02935, partial [Nitrospiraceae bacterium]|nr:hypothetical protein [Nitrospiraceae bacterium]
MVKINSNTKHHINRKIFNNKIFNRNIFSPRTINNEIAFDNRALSTELNTKLANTKIPNTKQSKISINVIFSISVTIVAVLVFFLLFFSQARVTNNLYCRTLLMFKTHNFENSLNPQLLECAKSIFSTPLVNEEIAYTNYFNGNKQKQLFTLVNHYQKDLTFTLPDNAIIESVVLNLSSESIIEPIRDYPTEVSAYLNDNGNISVPLKIRKSVDYFRNLSFVIVGSNRTKKLNVYFVYDPTASMAADINYTCDMIKKIQQHREIADVINATLWFSGTKPSFFDSTTKNNNPCYNISYRIINSSITNTYKDSSITLKDFTYSHVPGSVCYYTMYAFDSADEAWCYNSITLINYLKAIHQLNPTSYNKMPIKVAIVPVSDTAPTGGGSRYYF